MSLGWIGYLLLEHRLRFGIEKGDLDHVQCINRSKNPQHSRARERLGVEYQLLHLLLHGGMHRCARELPHNTFLLWSVMPVCSHKSRIVHGSLNDWICGIFVCQNKSVQFDL